jgi:hypothetical protein
VNGSPAARAWGSIRTRRRGERVYEGEDPDLGELTVEDVIREVETAVRMAEAESE